MARAHGKSPAQVMLRWGLQHGRSVIPTSTTPHRIAENIDVFDFELTGDEMTAIDGLDTGRRGGPEPDAVTLEAFGREIPPPEPSQGRSDAGVDGRTDRRTVGWPGASGRRPR